MDVKDYAFENTICSLSDKLRKASSARIAAANVCNEELRIHAERGYQLKNCSDELEMVRAFFRDDDDESDIYRKALERKHLSKLLQEEKRSSNPSCPPLGGCSSGIVE